MTRYKIGDTVIKASGSLRLRQAEQLRFCCLDDEVEVIAVHTVAQRYRACLVETGQACPMCQETEARPRMAMNILVYSDQGTVEIRQWIFGSDKYRQLAQIKALVPDGLDKHDLLMTCINETFQQVAFQISQTAEWMSGRFGPPEQVKAKFDKDKVDLTKFLRTKYSSFGMQPLQNLGQPVGFAGIVPVGFGGVPPMQPPATPFTTGAEGIMSAPPPGHGQMSAPGPEQEMKKARDASPAFAGSPVVQPSETPPTGVQQPTSMDPVQPPAQPIGDSSGKDAPTQPAVDVDGLEELMDGL